MINFYNTIIAFKNSIKNMRKKFTIILILFFLLGLTPFNFSNAITQNQINAEVQIVCPDDYGNWFSGSGTIIDPKGIILTNKHVVTDRYGGVINTCVIGFIESISQEPNFYTNNEVNVAEVKYYTTTNDMDAAILYLENLTNKIYPYINIWNSNSDTFQFGDKIEVMGFPSIGGSTITYTSGDFSGFGSSSYGTQNYIKATVSINHGNSGGAAYNSKGEFIGMPTFVIQDITNINYILSVNSIKNWLVNILGSGYQQKIIKEEPIIEDTLPTIQQDITPPDLSSILFEQRIGQYCDEDKIIIDAFKNSPNTYDTYYSGVCSSSEIYNVSQNYESENFSMQLYFKDIDAKVYIYLGSDINAIPSQNDDSTSFNISDLYYKSPPNFYLEDQKIQSTSAIYYVSKKLPQEGTYYLIIQAVDNANNYSDRKILQYNYRTKTIDTSLSPNLFKIYKDNTKTSLLYEISKDNFQDTYIIDNGYYVEWEYYNNEEKNLAFTVQLKEKLSSGEFNEETHSDEYDCRKYYYGQTCATTLLLNSTSQQFTEFQHLKKDIKYYFLFTVTDNDRQYSINPFSITYTSDKSKAKQFKESDNYDYELSKSLSGLILLQVESKGEAYYIYPSDSKKYYLGRPADAFNIMRELGLGATHQFINSYTIYPDHVLGKILIDVEQNGEAYYIYPKNKKAYYLGRPSDAFKIMRELGLGITNSDLNKIPGGNL